MTENKTARIRELNDAFRQSGRGGRIVMTGGVNAAQSDYDKLPEVPSLAMIYED